MPLFSNVHFIYPARNGANGQEESPVMNGGGADAGADTESAKKKKKKKKVKQEEADD